MWLATAEVVEWPVEVWSWAKLPQPPRGAFTLIADEAHAAQNLKSQRTKRFLDLADQAISVFPLTGTPIKNGRPANLFPLLLATKHDLARDRKRYEIRFCAAKATKWSRWDTTGAAHLKELHDLVADGILRRTKEECLNLPPKMRVFQPLELSAEAQRTYDETLDRLAHEYHERVTTGAISGEGEALVVLGQVRHASSLAKVESAVEIAQEIIEQGGQVVLYCEFTDTVERVARALNAVRITGDNDAQEREDAIRAFQAGAVKAIVITKAGGVGETLTAAQTVLMVDRPWTRATASKRRTDATGRVLVPRSYCSIRMVLRSDRGIGSLERKLVALCDIGQAVERSGEVEITHCPSRIFRSASERMPSKRSRASNRRSSAAPSSSDSNA